MGDPERIEPFERTDRFLRHVARKRDLKEDIVSPKAFEDRHPTLSLTVRRGSLATDEGIHPYRRAKKTRDGDLVGLCFLYWHQLVEQVRPALPPRSDRVEDDAEYGWLHCCTDRPDDPEDLGQKKVMAALATLNGVLCHVERDR